MNAENVAILSFIIYLSFFGWLGYTRGLTRELIVLIAAVAGWVVLAQRGSAVVSMANLAAAGFQFTFAGGFNGSEEEALQAILNAQKLVPDGQQDRFLYLSWIIGVAAVYLGTNWFVPSSNSKSNGWAILVGVANALLFAIVVMPGLISLFSETSGDIANSQSQWDLLDLFGRGIEMLWDGFGAVWGLLNPLGPMALLVILTGVLVFAAVRATS